MTTPTQLRAEGQADVIAADVAAHKQYAADIRFALAWSIESGVRFTADAIRRRAEDYARINGRHFDPAPDLLPAIIGGEAAAGRIRAVGHVQCTRTSRRAGWMRVWEVAPTTQQ